MRTSRVQRLRDQGFDDSYAVPFERAWRVRCSQCEALVINGIPTHEHTCPNVPRDDDSDEEETIDESRQCDECGAYVNDSGECSPFCETEHDETED